MAPDEQTEAEQRSEREIALRAEITAQQSAKISKNSLWLARCAIVLALVATVLALVT